MKTKNLQIIHKKIMQNLWKLQGVLHKKNYEKRVIRKYYPVFFVPQFEVLSNPYLTPAGAWGLILASTSYSGNNTNGKDVRSNNIVY